MTDLREMLLVQSKVREIIKAKNTEGNGIRTSDEFLSALNDFIHSSIEKAIERAQGNGRQTLRKEDI